MAGWRGRGREKCSREGNKYWRYSLYFLSLPLVVSTFLVCKKAKKNQFLPVLKARVFLGEDFTTVFDNKQWKSAP